MNKWLNVGIRDQIYSALEARPEGLSIPVLASWLDLTSGTVKKHIKRMEKDFIVERIIRRDVFVYKLTH